MSGARIGPGVLAAVCGLVPLGAAAQPAPVSGGAQPELNAQSFRPSIAGSRTLWVDEVGTAVDPALTGRILLHYTRDPLVYVAGDGREVGLVTDVVQLDLLVGAALDRLRFGLDLPLYLLERGEERSGSGLGELAVEGRAILTERARAPLGLALASRLSAPTASVGSALGGRAASAELTAVADRELGPVLIAANLGAVFGPRVRLEGLTLDDWLIARVGGGLSLGPGGGLSLEAVARASLASPPGEPGAAHGEWLAGGWTGLGSGLVLRGALGTGLGAGVGSPGLRLIGGVDWRPAPRSAPAPAAAPVLDADGDGIVDFHDACRGEAEDPDDVADTDGCPEPEVALRIRAVGPDGRAPPVVRAEVAGVRALATGGAESRVVLLPGDYEVTVAAAGFEGAVQRVEVGPEGTEIEVVLVPIAGLTVSRTAIASEAPIAFEPGSSRISEGTLVLDRVAAVLAEHTAIARLGVEVGAEPGDGGTSARAEALLRELIARGVAPERLRAAAAPERAAGEPLVAMIVEEWAP